MEKCRAVLERILPRDRWMMVLLAIVAGDVTYFVSRLFTGQLPHYCLQLPFEEEIPFLPWTVSVYFVCYLFWVVNYIIAFRQEREEALCFGTADLTGKLIGFLFFLLLPTTIDRPKIIGDGFWENMMRLLYTVDPPDNLFPSMHCMKSWACFIAVRNNPKIPSWYKVLSFLIAVTVFGVTLTTKQHVVADIIGGVLIIEVTYQTAKKYHWGRWYGRLVMRR